MKKLLLLTSFFFLLGQTVVLHGQTDVTTDTLRAAELLKTSRQLFESAKYDAAINVIDEAAVLYERAVGRESLEFAETQYRKGVCIYKKGDAQIASEYFHTSLDIQIKVLGENSTEAARSYNGLGNIYIDQGKHGQAEEYFKKSLNILVEIFGDDHLELVAPYENLGNLYLKMSNPVLSEEYLQKVLAIRLKHLGPEHPALARSYIGLGGIALNKRALAQAVEYNQKALAILEKTESPQPIDLLTTYHNIAFAHRLGNQADKALEYYQQCLFLSTLHFGEKHANTGVMHNNMAIVQHGKGDMDAALSNYRKALDVFLHQSGPLHPNVALCYNNIGEVYRIKGNLDKALEYYQKALDIMQETPSDNDLQKASILGNQGIIFALKGEFEKGLELFQKSIETTIKALGPDHIEVIRKYLNLGEVYRRKGDYEKALEYLHKVIALENELTDAAAAKVANAYRNAAAVYATQNDFIRAQAYILKDIEIMEQLYDPLHAEMAVPYYNLAVCERQLKAFDASASNTHRAFQALSYAGPQSLPRVSDVMRLLETLMHQGLLLGDMYRHDGRPEYLHAARHAFAEADEGVEYQFSTLENPGGQYTLAGAVVRLYESAIANNLLLRRLTDSVFYAQQAFGYAEKTKSHVLYGAMQDTRALSFAGLPDSLLEQERSLRIDITYYEKKRQAVDPGPLHTDSIYLNLSAKLFDLNEKHEALKRRLRREYPDYYRLRYDRAVATVSEVQQHILQPDQTLLEYFVGDSSIFAFVVRPDYFDIVEIPKDFPLDTWVSELRSAMTTNRSTAAALYCERAYQLYEKLLVPVKQQLSEELVIIPDGVLNYLPFEALLTQRPAKPARFRSHPYLLDAHRISYCYSATLLREMQDKQRLQAPPQNLLAMAPYSTGDSSLWAKNASVALRRQRRALNHSGGEVYGIRSIINGDALYGPAATKEKFLEAAHRYRIIHLATHAQADERAGDYSFIAFAEPADSTNDNLLYVRDIYNMAIHADLIALSACETGIGKLQRGEGIISLARAFAYAGAGSIVTSLWDVEDEHAKEFMLSFYSALHKGASKSDALRTAKRALAARPAGHPFFWAAFIGIGDMRPLYSDR
jgi:CHAT domain-containing protein/Tfp pilus assembly protein PilF